MNNLRRSLGIIRQNISHLRNKWIEPIIPTRQFWQSVFLMKRYLSDWFRYKKMADNGRLRFIDSYPCLFDRTATAPFDSHYFYQDIWAFKEIQHSNPPFHIDVGSRVIFVGFSSAVTQVIFVDIRPLLVKLKNFHSVSGSILELPFENNSLISLSCLHVAEHIGLGRYGDLLDPEGTIKAAQELTRVLAPGGNLYFSVPVGKSRICFNAHRIHSPGQILNYFQDLKLVQFSAVNDDRNFIERISPAKFAEADYACGMFHFTKEP